MLLKKILAITLLFSLFSAYLPTPVQAQSPTIESFTSTGTITGNGTTLSVNLPTGVSAGDLLVACVAATGNDTSNMSASGWTHVITAGGSGISPKVGMLYRFWQPGDSSPAVFTISSTNNLAARRGVMWRISGADATPSDATPSSNVSGTSTSRVYNSITTNTNDALLLGCLNWTSNDSVYTPDTDLSNTATLNLYAADSGVQTTAGATGNFTGSGNNSPYVSILWAVAPGESPINNVPAITLNSPANSATGVSTTPTFTLTGTDADSDDLTYEIQITDNPNDFIGGEVLTDNFSGGGGAAFHPQPHPSGLTWQGNIQVDDRMCQSFTARGGKWAKTVFPLGDSRTDTSGTSYARIYEHSGTFGTSSAPINAGAPNNQTTSGTPTTNWLAISNGVSLGASFASGNFNFTASGANQIRFGAGQKYLVCGDWIPDNNLENNTWAWYGDALNAGALHNGNLYHDGYSVENSGPHAEWDLHFSMYESFTLESAGSPTDAGFTNNVNGADTSPFTAGNQITYTAQQELDADITYYWRARVNDGTVYSDWTTTQSFTTSATPSPTATPTPTATPSPTATPTPTATPSPTATPTTSQVGTTNTSGGSAPVCTDSKPFGTPNIFQISTTENTAKIFFTPLSSTNSYYISYSPSPSAEEHGVNVTLGSDGVQSYTIGFLKPETSYYFKVRGQNGCATGNWSSIVSSVTAHKPTLMNTILDDSLVITKITTEVPTQKNTPTPKIEKQETPQAFSNHDVTITIILSGKPVVGAQVELHSNPKYGTTDQYGQVTFADVEKGTHTLIVHHDNKKVAQKLNVEGSTKEFNISVTLEMRESHLPDWAWITLVSALTAATVMLVIKNYKHNNKS